ncbi:MAG TPA: SDR family NAD(P)-dependent oxidoreductase [Baekduia sp.]|nr:SDR family NAD(P)-dependent oxidoreductase [Baekduia sp.]
MADPVAIVTGAASGIGRATAELFAERGWRVTAADRQEGPVRDFAAQAPERRLAVAVDVRDAGEVARMVERTAATFGALNALVAVAGVEIDRPVDALDENDWDLVIDTNLKGTYLCCRAAVPHLRDAGGGALITTGSVLGRLSMPGVTAYAAAKAGIEALTRTMALDHAADGIRAVCVLPGTTDTPLVWQGIADADLPAAKRAAAADVPVGFVAQPRHIAEVIAFAVSPAAAFVTGTSLVADGGTLARIAATF